MTKEVEELTAEQRVLKVWPDAWSSGTGHVWEYRSQKKDFPMSEPLGNSWQDAASRLDSHSMTQGLAGKLREAALHAQRLMDKPSHYKWPEGEMLILPPYYALRTWIALASPENLLKVLDSLASQPTEETAEDAWKRGFEEGVGEAIAELDKCRLHPQTKLAMFLLEPTPYVAPPSTAKEE